MEALILMIDIALMVVLLRFVVRDKGGAINQDLGIFQYPESDKKTPPKKKGAENA